MTQHFQIARLLLFALQLNLPSGNDSWLVQVVSTGGLTGKGAGNFTISSEGRVLCSLPEMHCPDRFAVSQFSPLIEVIQSGRIHPFRPTPPSFCNDCFTWTIIIRSRDSKGTLQTYTALWDDLSRPQVPPEIIRIFDAVVALRK
jgi:hypothetical protein